MRPSRSSVTRFSGSGRSSEVSQKSIECFAIRSSVQPGAIAGAPARRVSASTFPTKEICPMGYSHSGEPK